MQESFANRSYSIAPVDAIILAIAQIIQPADKDEIYEAVKDSPASADLDKGSFRSHFHVLENAGYCWRTADDKFVVTPQGDALARRSMNSKTRDKIRLLILNKERYIL